MKGYWLTRNNVIFATGKSPYTVEKLIGVCERRGSGKKKQYFVPAYQCTEDFQSKNIPVVVGYEQKDQILNQLAGNVDFNEQDNTLNDQLKRAKIEETKVRTKHLNEKLDFRKKELFTEWSQKFFNVFADQFGKLRNCLINMHLNEEQVKVFNQTLDHCINNLELHLTDVWTEFKAQQEQKNEKED